MVDVRTIDVSKPRWLALDVLRGLAVAGMILVTSPGDWNRAYWPLKHADWHGWTPTDIIFPTFLFAVGLALGLSFPLRLQDGSAPPALWARIGRRVVALIALGLALELVNVALRTLGAPGIGVGDLAHMRLPGVLQRIGLCYGLAALLIIATGIRRVEGSITINARAILIAIAIVLIGYWAAMTFVPVPGFGAGHLDPEGNLAAYIDRATFSVAHLWPLGSVEWSGPVVYDPEGLLSTFPATVNTLVGVLAARGWARDPDRALWRIALGGALLLIAGLLADHWFPINKRIWTSSFALLSSGLSALLLVMLAAVLRSAIMRRIAWPLLVLGGNAIAAFVLSILYGYLRGIPFIPHNGGYAGTQLWANDLVLAVLPDPYLASLVNAIAAVAIITGLVWLLHRRGVHLRL